MNCVDYLIFRHCIKLRSQRLVLSVVEEGPSLLQALAHQGGLQLFIALLVAYKTIKLSQNQKSELGSYRKLVICANLQRSGEQ